MSAPTFEERFAGLRAEKGERDFWDARPHLKHIRDAAHSRQRSAPATLAVVLARVAAMVNHRIRIPAIVGSDSSLSVLVAVVAPAGVGKSSATAIGAELLPVPEGFDMLDQLPIGSGEGLVEAFFDLVEEENDKGKTIKVKKQVRHNAFVNVDEGQVLAEIGGRRGATLLPTLRSIFSGSTLGQQNASEERRRILPARSYTMGVAIALQSTLASALLDDAAGGTPQRVLWVPAVDDTLPAVVEGPHGPELPDLPDWPGPLPWRPPAVGQIAGLDDDGLVLMETGPVYLRVAGAIRREIRLADLARARGEATVEVLDAHEGLVRLKMAALFALLDDRLDVNDEDWQLATAFKAVSDRTREGVVAAVRREQTEQERQASAKLANRAVHADLAVTRRRVVDCARKLAAKVWAEPDRWTVSELRREPMRRYRDVLDDALDHAAAEGWVVEVVETGQGYSKRTVRPGERRPT